MHRVLLSWIGHTDLRAPEETDIVGVGPVAQALDARPFDEAFLLTDHEESDSVDIASGSPHAPAGSLST